MYVYMCPCGHTWMSQWATAWGCPMCREMLIQMVEIPDDEIPEDVTPD